MKEYVSIEIGRAKNSENEIIVELGRKEMTIQEIADFQDGSIIKLDKKSNEPVDVFASGQLTAKGTIEVIEGKFAVEVTDVFDDKNNVLSLFALNNVIILENEAHEMIDVLTNGKLIAKGFIIRVNDNNFNLFDFRERGEDNFGILIKRMIH